MVEDLECNLKMRIIKDFQEKLRFQLAKMNTDLLAKSKSYFLIKGAVLKIEDTP